MHVVIVIFLNRSCFKNNEEINVPKRPIFWKMCSDLKQDIRKSWDLHTIVQAYYTRVWGSVRKTFSNMSNIKVNIEYFSLS